MFQFRTIRLDFYLSALNGHILFCGRKAGAVRFKSGLDRFDLFSGGDEEISRDRSFVYGMDVRKFKSVAQRNPFQIKDPAILLASHLKCVYRVEEDGHHKNKEKASPLEKVRIPSLFPSLYFFNPLSL